jgi:hypothetical protein
MIRRTKCVAGLPTQRAAVLVVRHRVHLDYLMPTKPAMTLVSRVFDTLGAAE